MEVGGGGGEGGVLHFNYDFEKTINEFGSSAFAASIHQIIFQSRCRNARVGSVCFDESTRNTNVFDSIEPCSLLARVASAK